MLNGNGHQGAAAQGAARLQRVRVRDRRDGERAPAGLRGDGRDVPAGLPAEALRLASDLKVKVVGPLDGLAPSALRGGQLAIVIGA